MTNEAVMIYNALVEPLMSAQVVNNPISNGDFISNVMPLTLELIQFCFESTT